MDEIAVLVAEKLDFDMAGPRDELFEKDVRGAEGNLRFALSLFESAGEVGRGADDAHAAAAAPF